MNYECIETKNSFSLGATTAGILVLIIYDPLPILGEAGQISSIPNLGASASNNGSDQVDEPISEGLSQLKQEAGEVRC